MLQVTTQSSRIDALAQPAPWARAAAVSIGMLILAAALAFVAKGYVLFQLTMILCYTVALIGLNLLTGYNGQISLGHGAFFAVGAYAMAALVEKAGWAYWVSLPIAAIVCGVAGYLFGRPALKLQGVYLALATFTLGVATPQLLKYKHLEPVTGGVGGIVVSQPEAPFGLPVSPDQWLYLFTLGVTVVVIVLARNLIESGTGRAMRAIRDHDLAAESMGIDNAHYKSMTFAVSAAFTGLGGALFALVVQFVAPDSFTLALSVSLLIGMVVGGIGTLWGALFGAAFILFVPNVAERISKDLAWGVYGAVLIFFVFVMPGGVVGLLSKVRQWLYARRRAR